MDLFGFKKRRMKEYEREYRELSPEERQDHFKRLEIYSLYEASSPFRNKALIEMCQAAMAVDEEEEAAEELH